MQRKELEELYAVETDFWWFAGKRIFMRRLLGDHLRGRAGSLRILDVGCGTGANAIDMSAYGEVTASDRSLDALRMAAERGVRHRCAASAPDLPFATNSFDIVTAFDILEHVDDDLGFLDELTRVLRPGGALAIHVPAWPSLWSGHDVVLEHKRRYTYRGLRALMKRSSLDIEHFGWASCAILAPTAALRWVRRALGDDAAADQGRVPRPLNSLLRELYRAEAAMALSVGLPFGLSLAVIAVKPQDS